MRSVRIFHKRASFGVRSSAERGLCGLENVRSRFKAQPVQNLSLSPSSHFLHKRILRWLHSWSKKKIYIYIYMLSLDTSCLSYVFWHFKIQSEIRSFSRICFTRGFAKRPKMTMHATESYPCSFSGRPQIHFYKCSCRILRCCCM